MNKLSKEFKSGFIFLLAIVFLVYGLKYLKGLNVFQSNKPYYAIYDDIDGLQIGSSIRLNGFNVGMVNNIVLSNNNKLLVTLNINSVDSIPINSVCKIVNQDLMGTKGVSLVLGKSDLFAKPGDTLQSGIENSLQDEVNAQILPLKNKGAIRLTISKYYLPSGKSISGTGIIPDIEIDESSDEFRIGTETDNQLDFTITLLNG